MLRWLLRGIAVVVLLVAGAAIGLHYLANTPLVLPADGVEFTLKPGSSARAAGRQLASAGVPVRDWQIELLARIEGRAGQLKAGTYLVPNGITPRALIAKMVRGDFVQAELTLLEGWTFRQVRKALADAPDLRSETAGLSDRAILAAVGATETHPEGLFFPDTYVYAKGTSDLAILKLAYAAMKRQLATAWAARDASVPLATPYAALTLASIIEKETGKPEERGQVAAVFANRLRQGMRLQTDPTVIYGLGERFDGNLRKRDLLEDTPYNTYTRAGLPPTPIAMPGKAALEAAVRPPASDALYFVARGDGTSQFSASLDDHNRAVTRYQLRGGR